MADRSVKVTIGANVAPLKAAMADGAKSVDGLGGTVTTLGDRIKKGFAFVGVTGGIVSLGAAIKGTFSLGLNFTRQLNDLQAVTQATDETMKRVSATARQLGNDVEIPATSASDAAEAMTELAKGGLSVQQAMDAAKGTLQLAAAAQVSGAQAAEIQANALNTFGLSASDASRVADVLANTANAASGDITDFAQGMQQSGSVAKLFGINIEDTSTALGLFANAGIKGSDAGTSLKTMLTQLATPSTRAKSAMADLGLTIYDNQGKFVGLRSLTEQLAAAQGRMSDAAFQSAAGIVFGSDAIRAASILASGGAGAYDEFRASVDRVGGAAELAGAKMKGLPGALQTAQNAMEDVALQVYERLAPAIETIVRGFADAIPAAAGVLVPVLNIVLGVLGAVVKVVGIVASAVGALPGPVIAFGAALAGLAIAQKLGLFSALSSAFDSVRLRAMYAGDAIKGMSFASITSGAKAAGSSLMNAFGGPWGLALAGGVTAVTLLGKAFEDAKPKVADFTAAIDENTGALAANGARAVIDALQRSGAVDGLERFGVSLGDYTKAVIGEGNAYDEVRQKLVAYRDENWKSHLARDAVEKQIGQLDEDHRRYAGTVADTKAAIEAETAVTGASGAAMDSAADSWSRAGDIAAGTAGQIDGLSDAVRDQVNALLDLLNVASQTRSAISGSITGFVSPTGAYEAAMRAANAKPAGGGSSKPKADTSLVDAATRLADQAKKDRDAIDQRYADILDVSKARYDEQLSAFEKARDAVKAAADEAQRAAQEFLSNSRDRANAAKDEAAALATLADFGSGGSALASALEAQAVAQAKLNVARAEQVKVERQLSTVADPKQRAEMQDRLNTLIAQQSSLQAVAAAADKTAAEARAELAKNTDLSTTAAQAALDAMQKQASAAADVIAKDQEAANTAETSAARKTAADSTFVANKAKADADLKRLQDQRDRDVKTAEDKYQRLLDAKNAAEEKSKAASEAHGSGVSGAAVKMVEDVKPSFTQYMAELRKQVEAQENWKNNIVDLASRVGPDIAIELAKMGPEAAPMIQMLADQTDDKLKSEWVPLFKKSTAQGTQDILDELTRALDPTGEKGLQLGNKVITGLQDALKAAKDDPTAKAAIQAVLDTLQTVANQNHLKVYLSLDQAKLNQQLANTFGPGYNPASYWGQGGMWGMAKGGWIPGAANGEWITGGTPGRDSVLRWLMPGEAVIPTAQAQANKPIVDALMAGRPLVIPQQSAGSQRAVSVVVNLDGRQIGRTVAPVIADEIRIQGSALR